MAIRMLASVGILRTSEREFIFEMAETLGIERSAAADLGTFPRKSTRP